MIVISAEDMTDKRENKRRSGLTLVVWRERLPLRLGSSGALRLRLGGRTAGSMSYRRLEEEDLTSMIMGVPPRGRGSCVGG